ncbi:MAG: hypothetical protein IPK63_21835 [Candidatus Competibacteraceae bacterium]|nr:hypothetical protein [Candidatus Competibacteraceae bacterium]MBK8185402.1 hypothetical protein [Candidatus Competibacteraceae bacterium]
MPSSLKFEVLKKFYEHRAESDYCPTELDFDGVDLQTIYTACEVLKQEGLIRWWRATRQPSLEGLSFGIGYISVEGLRLMEKLTNLNDL